jgi:hypothetical protein
LITRSLMSGDVVAATVWLFAFSSISFRKLSV